MSGTVDLPGFADPVRETQATFRAVLAAMATPGSLHAAGSALTAPAPLAPATAAVLLSLADIDTPLWLDTAAAAAREWIAFHTGAGVVEAARARFALSLACPDFAAFAMGSDEAPEESCTLILQVKALGAGAPFRLRGPGLRTAAMLLVDGLPGDFAARWAANHALFPRGLDIILCAGTRLAAWPRSLRVEDA